jgi:hypothetical protein
MAGNWNTHVQKSYRTQAIQASLALLQLSIIGGFLLLWIISMKGLLEFELTMAGIKDAIQPKRGCAWQSCERQRNHNNPPGALFTPRLTERKYK